MLKNKRRPSAQLDMTPLIDVVFLLLMFFMLTSTFATQEAMDLTLPSSSNSTEASHDSIVVTIGVDDQIQVDGKPVTLVLLADRVALRLEEQADLPVILMADQKLQVQRMIDVMDRLREAGANHVELATQGAL